MCIKYIDLGMSLLRLGTCFGQVYIRTEPNISIFTLTLLVENPESDSSVSAPMERNKSSRLNVLNDSERKTYFKSKTVFCDLPNFKALKLFPFKGHHSAARSDRDTFNRIHCGGPDSQGKLLITFCCRPSALLIFTSFG